MRPDWDETWMAVADVIAMRSRCVRDQVGAVIVDVENRVAATGYNGPPARLRVDPGSCNVWCERAINGPADPLSYRDCPSIHAELNAIAYASRHQTEGGTLYCTSNLCWDCAKVVANSGILRVVMRDGRGYRDVSGVVQLLRDCRIEVEIT